MSPSMASPKRAYLGGSGRGTPVSSCASCGWATAAVRVLRRRARAAAEGPQRTGGGWSARGESGDDVEGDRSAEGGADEPAHARRAWIAQLLVDWKERGLVQVGKGAERDGSDPPCSVRLDQRAMLHRSAVGLVWCAVNGEAEQRDHEADVDDNRQP